MTLLEQLAAIYAMPLGELLLIAVVALALAVLKLFTIARQLRADLDYRATLARTRLHAIRGGRA